jgi:hypothetical protein
MIDVANGRETLWKRKRKVNQQLCCVGRVKAQLLPELDQYSD